MARILGKLAGKVVKKYNNLTQDTAVLYIKKDYGMTVKIMHFRIIFCSEL